MKQVQIVVPFDKTEEVYAFLLDVVGIKNIMKFNADNAHQLQFRVTDDHVNDTIERLKSRGVGVEYGFIDILDLKASLPREADETREQTIQREATLAVEEIYENVKAQTWLSFDFLAFTILAALMAGVGLIQNNVTIIVASMLLSPLMGPMLGVALGYVVSDRALLVKGTYNELIALVLSIAVGALMGAVMAMFSPGFGFEVDAQFEAGIFTEITRRGFPFSWLDIGVAVFSGAAVAVSVTKGDMSTLVGVAISAALMPPAVNVGMMIVVGLANATAHGVAIGVWSLLLLGMNIILIDIAAVLMFRIKKLTPISAKSATWKAVTEFQTMRSETLYHTRNDRTPTEVTRTTFTPAPTTEGPSAEVEVSEEGDASSEKSSPQS
ncbi:MAG: TIGR00341 family protein [Candidatus Thorarchaeota archaeon]|nr:MAG: TIGR00341 family protein [Candidatus Thorarchaeota archaeon]